MKTVRLLHRVALATLAAFVLVQPAAAQDETEADTIWVEGDKTIVIMSDEGRRVIVRSADDDGPRFFFDSEGGTFSRFFDHDGPIRLRGHAPRIMEFHGDLLDDKEHVAVLGDYLDTFGNVWVDRLGGDIEVAESMKHRSEVMRMEMESRRLAQRARRAEGEERTRLESELEEKLQEIFARKQALREEQIDQLREEMNEALDKHNERSQNRQEIIERRLNQLLGKSTRYDW